GAGAPGVLHGEAVVEEIKLMRKAGLSLEAAIRCASANGAAFLGLDRLGPLKPGARATFLVVRGGPQQVPRKLGYLEAIYVNGAPSSAYSKEPRNW
ncbi:MAG TPA: amidohydrolase, partial [Desulfobacterales bacterium]|nr:amidohydrolase [Desulfobacterales bacterium]